eukprot:SM000001S04628  [mRNA]  locus=s1:1351776:1354794:+ [translate_table: standard]
MPVVARGVKPQRPKRRRLGGGGDSARRRCGLQAAGAAATHDAADEEAPRGLPPANGEKAASCAADGDEGSFAAAAPPVEPRECPPGSAPTAEEDDGDADGGVDQEEPDADGSRRAGEGPRRPRAALRLGSCIDCADHAAGCPDDNDHRKDAVSEGKAEPPPSAQSPAEALGVSAVHSLATGDMANGFGARPTRALVESSACAACGNELWRPGWPLHPWMGALGAHWAPGSAAGVPSAKDQPAAAHPGCAGDGAVGGVQSATCRVCGEVEAAGRTLICDTCGCSFHLHCLQPKLQRPPVLDEWFCGACSIEKGQSGSALMVDDMMGWDAAAVAGGVAAATADLFAAANASANIAAPGREDWGSGGREGECLDCESGPQRYLFLGGSCGRVRIGRMCQASVPAWTEQQAMVMAAAGNEGSGAPALGQEAEVSVQEKKRELREAVERNRRWLAEERRRLERLKVEPLAGKGEKWVQCRCVLVKEGQPKSDGRPAKRSILCAKWRRVPATVQVSDKWECFDNLFDDPWRADCNVPQELGSKELEVILRAQEETRQAKTQERGWEQKFQELEAFLRIEGHCHVPRRTFLGQWLHSQRIDAKRGRLTPQQKVCV